MHGSSVWPLIYLSICVSHRTSCISITASRLVTVFAQWLLILLSQHNWVEAPHCFTAHQSPRLESVIDGFTCAHTTADKHTHTHAHTQREKQNAESIRTTLYLSHSSSTRPRSRPDICRNNKRLFLHANTHTHTHTHTFRHAHLPMCSLTLTWVGFPAVQAVSSINMCLLAGDPYVCITGRQ